MARYQKVRVIMLFSLAIMPALRGSSAEEPVRIIRVASFRILLPPGGRETVQTANDLVINDRLLDRVFVDENPGRRFGVNGGSRESSKIKLYLSDFDSELRQTFVNDVADLRHQSQKRFGTLIEELGIKEKDVSRAMLEGRLNPYYTDIYRIMPSSRLKGNTRDELLKYARHNLISILRSAIENNSNSRDGIKWLKKEKIITVYQKKKDEVIKLELDYDALNSEHVATLIKSKVFPARNTGLCDAAIDIGKWNERYGTLTSCIGAQTIVNGKDTEFNGEHLETFREQLGGPKKDAWYARDSVLYYLGIGSSGLDHQRGKKIYNQLRNDRYLPKLRKTALRIVQGTDKPK